MRKSYKNEKIKFYLGDVRDFNSIENAGKELIMFFMLQL